MVILRRSKKGKLGVSLALALVGVLAPHGAGAGDRAAHEIMAVFAIEMVGDAGIKRSAVATFTGLLGNAVSNAGYRTVPRSEINEALAEQKAESYKSCYDEACQIELGKQVAASHVVSSRWSPVASLCVLDLTIVDLARGITTFSMAPKAPCTEAGLSAAIDSIGAALQSDSQAYGTFALDLKADEKIKNPPTDASGYVSIHARAAGRPDERINVYINGKLRGVLTGGIFVEELPVGSYIVRLHTAGDRYERKRITIEIEAGDRKRYPPEGTIELESRFGYLIFRGTPASAVALVNGDHLMLRGPHRQERRSGAYDIVVEAPGYIRSEDKRVEVLPGKEAVFEYRLVRNAGTLKVAGSPTGAEVLLDNKRVGSVPLTLRDVDVGDHSVEVSAPGYASVKRRTQVKLQTTASVRVQLRPKLARLKVEAKANVMGVMQHVEADVFLDGRRLDQPTPWRGTVLADVEHTLELGLGTARTPPKVIRLAEGAEEKKIVQVPQSWGGAVSTLRFDLVDGPWEVRSGPMALDLDAPNAVRPGRVPVNLLLDGKLIGHSELVISPEENRLITVVSRPKTDAELNGARTSWQWRRWLSLGLALGAGAVGSERIVAAHREAAARDDAIAAMPGATTSVALDAFRQEAVDREGAREVAQTIGLGTIGAAAGLGLWALLEWIVGEPTVGRLEGTNIEPVPVQEAK